MKKLIRPTRRGFIAGAAATFLLPAQAKSQIFGQPPTSFLAYDWHAPVSTPLICDATWNNRIAQIRPADGETIAIMWPAFSTASWPFQTGVYNLNPAGAVRIVLPQTGAPNDFGTDTICGNSFEWYVGGDDDLWPIVPDVGADNSNWSLPGRRPGWGRQPDIDIEIPPGAGGAGTVTSPAGSFSQFSDIPGYEVQLGEMLQSGSSRELVTFEFSAMSTAPGDRCFFTIADDYGDLEPAGAFSLAAQGVSLTSLPTKFTLSYETPGGYLQSTPLPGSGLQNTACPSNPGKCRTLKPSRFRLRGYSIYGSMTVGAGGAAGRARVSEWAVA